MKNRMAILFILSIASLGFLDCTAGILVLDHHKQGLPLLLCMVLPIICPLILIIRGATK